MTVADHVVKVMKPNFAASWEEVGEENELEDTFALSTMKTLEGQFNPRFHITYNLEWEQLQMITLTQVFLAVNNSSGL